ncbi:hypothetical protein BKH41_03695 [Helicobacter sp. 12S02232-10]|uniref:helix-turn-helix domain-containing protein n=1 Tax=Helicobacter sp. 12S02232-10 TaxID=1476197 RepID=UPI000BA62F84|nr:hypothetical protein [Helicobacter sp. 12S02232-10]PAF49196.1 hypothetical protein BKH41_03695 [Helicobacter sp. 12S02232-10]
MNGNEFKAIREKLGLTQKKWGDLLGLSLIQIYRLEKKGEEEITEPIAKLTLLLSQNESSLISIGSNVVQIKGDRNNINHMMHPIDSEMQELIDLLRTYATPKMKMDLKEKLLKYKEFEEKMNKK